MKKLLTILTVLFLTACATTSKVDNKYLNKETDYIKMKYQEKMIESYDDNEIYHTINYRIDENDDVKAMINIMIAKESEFGCAFDSSMECANQYMQEFSQEEYTIIMEPKVVRINDIEYVKLVVENLDFDNNQIVNTTLVKQDKNGYIMINSFINKKYLEDYEDIMNEVINSIELKYLG